MDITLDQSLNRNDKHQDDLNEDPSGELLRDGQTQMTGNSEHSGLYFRQNDNGQVTYRVVQVGGSENNQQATLSIVSTNGIQNILPQTAAGSTAPQVAIVANSFSESGEGSSSSTAAMENPATKFAYFSQGNNTADAAQDISSQSGQNLAQGQFYVMMSPQDVMQSQTSKHQLAPKNQFAIQKLDTVRGSVIPVRDSNRRVQHNEVERRRRDKINNWIMKLSKLVPDCVGDSSKQGQSKGGILAKTCDYLASLQASQQHFLDSMKEMEALQEELEETRLHLEEKKRENAILHQALRSHGIAVDIKSTSNMS